MADDWKIDTGTGTHSMASGASQATAPLTDEQAAAAQDKAEWNLAAKHARAEGKRLSTMTKEERDVLFAKLEAEHPSLRPENSGQWKDGIPEDVAEELRKRPGELTHGAPPPGAHPAPTAVHTGAVGEQMSVADAQRVLKAEGLDLGPAGVDGRQGKFTTAAIEQFQKSEGVPVTGKLDAATVAALREEAEEKGIKLEGHEKGAGAPAAGSPQPRPQPGQQTAAAGQSSARHDTTIDADDIKASLAKSHVDVADFKQKLEERTGIVQSAGTDVDPAMVAAVNQAVSMDRRVNFARGAMAQADHDARGAETGGRMIDAMDNNMDRALQQARHAGAARGRDDGFGFDDVADGAKAATRVVSQASRAARQISGIFS